MGTYENEWITLSAFPISQAPRELSQLLLDRFGFPQVSCQNIIDKYFTVLREDISVLIEFPYVDKVFRNSYYHYFSSKHHRYERDSIRLSLFEGHVSEGHFDDPQLLPVLSDSFLGVIIIRPTFPQLFGRTTLSPRAFKWNDFVVCLAKTPCSINGLQLHVAAFPHASQDSEHLTCAETSIWSIMEYFGHKYPDYVPVLPSHIINALSNPAVERVVPSHGLSMSQISFALKQFGFGPRIYSREAFQNKERDFRRILSWYVESGIPVIVALAGTGIGHAVLAIGHENIACVLNNGSNCCDFNVGSGVVDAGDLNKRYIVIDNNYPPYQVCSFDEPAGYYAEQRFKALHIAAFVVPLYPRIYLEPVEAYSLALRIIENVMAPPGDMDQIVTRFFLTSSRSYKSWVLRSTVLQLELKEVLLTISMPKFIWVTEISNSELFMKCRAQGMVIIDATGDASSNSLLFFAYKGSMYLQVNGVYKELKIGFSDFSCYENNLKGEWSEWKT